MPIEVDGNSKLSKALKLHKDVLEYIIRLEPHDFERLRNPVMRRLMPPRISLARIARMTGTPLGDLLCRIHDVAGIPLTAEERDRLRAAQAPTAGEERVRPAWTLGDPAQTVDLLESDERLDADPMLPIARATKAAKPGAVILIRHKWEPQPLYDIWDKIGVEHFAEQVAPDEWRIYIRKGHSVSE